MTTSRLAGETILAANYNADIDLGPMGIIARAGPRTTSSTTTTGTQGVLRIDDVQLRTGRSYRIQTSSLNGDSSVGTDDVVALITFTADGSTPTTGSTTLPGSRVGGDVNGGGTNSWIIPISTRYDPAGGDELWSGLLCVQRTAGSGNASLFADTNNPIQFWIEDMGAAVVNSGTNI